MISFDSFKPDNSSPMYLQILSFVKRGIACGAITDGDELPSRRALSVLLGINPNTVQRAFSMLEEEGLISSSHGVTSVVTAPPERVRELKEEILAADARNTAALLKQNGLSLEQAMALLAVYWEEV
ncbi:MAG: GntR family transcriptional regulator [Firmicutes bacterium]|nr:GntR family transcriptional regulator [Bacillota bacterium]